MNDRLQRYALFAEIASALAIVLSLFFVGLQVRQGNEETRFNSEVVRSQVQQSMMDADMTLLLYMADNPEYAPNNPAVIMEGERAIPSYILFHAMVRSREHYWRQLNNGLLDESTYLTFVRPLLLAMQNVESAAPGWMNDELDGYEPGYVADLWSRLQAIKAESIDQEESGVR